MHEKYAVKIESDITMDQSAEIYQVNRWEIGSILK